MQGQTQVGASLPPPHHDQRLPVPFSGSLQDPGPVAHLQRESSYRGTRLLCLPPGVLLTMKLEVLEKKAMKSKDIFQI